MNVFSLFYDLLKMYRFIYNIKIHSYIKNIEFTKRKIVFRPNIRAQSNLINDKLKTVYCPECELKHSKKHYLSKFIQKSPVTVQPYLELIRLDKPIGSWVIFWPSTWSIGIAATPGGLPDLYLLSLFGMGSFMMRSIGCTINDILDRDIDKLVARTMERPIVTGTITVKSAIKYLAAQLSVALIILLQLNEFSVVLGSCCVALVTMYPLVKRITNWPQLMLGLTLNWGVLVGYSATVGHLDSSVLPIYLAAISWTIFYDTIYAHQDISDDILHNVKSTAIKFQENTKYWLSGLAAFMTGNLVIAGKMAEQTWPLYCAIALNALQLSWQIYSLDIKNPADCGTKFRSNFYVGLIIFSGVVLGNLWKKDVVHTELNNKTM